MDLTQRDAVWLKSEASQVMRSATHAAWIDVTKLKGLVVDKSVSVTHTITNKPTSDEEWGCDLWSGLNWTNASASLAPSSS